MLSDTQQHFGGFERSGGRGVRRTGAVVSAAGLAALVAAALLAAAPASAQRAAGGAPTFTHSAKSGELRDGRLILHGVARRVHTMYEDGRTDRVPVKRLHALLFLRGKPATATLRHSGGNRATLRLSRPGYNAVKRTVSYRAKPLSKGSVPRRFGRASLSMVAHAQLKDSNGQDCKQIVYNNTQYDFKVTSSWMDNQWLSSDPLNRTMSHQLGNNLIVWESGLAGFATGCHNNATLQIVSDDPRFNPSDGGKAYINYEMQLGWNAPLAGATMFNRVQAQSALFTKYFWTNQNADGSWYIAQY